MRSCSKSMVCGVLLRQMLRNRIPNHFKRLRIARKKKSLQTHDLYFETFVLFVQKRTFALTRFRYASQISSSLPRRSRSQLEENQFKIVCGAWSTDRCAAKAVRRMGFVCVSIVLRQGNVFLCCPCVNQYIKCFVCAFLRHNLFNIRRGSRAIWQGSWREHHSIMQRGWRWSNSSGFTYVV